MADVPNEWQTYDSELLLVTIRGSMIFLLLVSSLTCVVIRSTGNWISVTPLRGSAHALKPCR